MAKTVNIDLREDFSRNYIINGSLDFWQRGFNFTATGGIYTTDRFKAINQSTATFDVNRSTDVPNSSTTYSIEVDGTTTGTPGVGDIDTIQYIVEGYDIQPLIGKKATLSFYAKSSLPGTYSITLRNDATDAHYHVEYVVNAVDTWEKKLVSIELDSSIVYNIENGRGLIIDWVLASDRTSAIVDSWEATDQVGSDNQVNLFSGDNTMKFAQIQLLEGEQDVEFRRAGIFPQEEFRLCQRYYETSKRTGNFPGVVTGSPAENPAFVHNNIASGSNRFVAVARFAVEKRTTPTRVVYDRVGTSNRVTIWNNTLGTPTNNQVFSESAVGNKGIQVRSNAVSTYSIANLSGMEAHWIVEAEL